MPAGSLGVGNRAVKTYNCVPLSVTLSQLPLQQIQIHSLKWTGMDKFNSDDYYIYYYGQESLRRNGIVLIINRRIQNAVLECNLKNDRMISVHFQGKGFNITVIQVYAPTTNAKEAEWFYEDLQDLLELTPKKMSFSS